MYSKKCPTIMGLKLDRESLSGVNKIKSIRKDIKATRTLLSTGVIYNIFTNMNVPSVAFNITQADWEVFAKSSTHLGAFKRNLIRIEAISHKIRYTHGSKQRKFWEAVEYGCAI